MPLSVIMPAYNAAQYVAQALQSLVHRQGDVRLDVIVVNDGSTDGTADVVRHTIAQHSEVRLIDAPHEGVAAARNRGLDALPADASFVTFHDADDIVYPGRIPRQLAKLESDSGLQVVYGVLQLFDQLDDETLLPCPHARTATLRGISLSAGLYRRGALMQTGRFDESLGQAEDTDFLFRLVESGAKVLMEDEIATFYRRHDSNTTNDHTTARREFMRAIHKSVVRRRKTGNAVAPLASGLFGQQLNIEEQFALCPSNTQC